jgi:choline dehydrogenase-like flavoprotein
VDVLIIGAGLTGASAAYHLGPAVRDRSLRVALIDRGDPATEASGRNGGNFELLPENSVGLYGGWRASGCNFSCMSTLRYRSKSFAQKANGKHRWFWEWPLATATGFRKYR